MTVETKLKELDSFVANALKHDMSDIEKRVLAGMTPEEQKAAKLGAMYGMDPATVAKPQVKKGVTMGRMWANFANLVEGRTSDPVFKGVDNREGGTLWEDDRGLFLRYPQTRRVGNQFRNDPVEWRLVRAVRPTPVAQMLQMVVYQHPQLPLICIFQAPNGAVIHRHMTMATG